MPHFPASPVLLYVDDKGSMSWQGWAGAFHYRIEKSASAGGPWETSADEVTDAGNIMYESSKTADLPLYADPEYSEGTFYRIIAVSESGDSVPSNELKGE